MKPKYPDASTESLEYIEARECTRLYSSQERNRRFKAVFNELHKLYALVEELEADRERMKAMLSQSNITEEIKSIKNRLDELESFQFAAEESEMLRAEY